MQNYQSSIVIYPLYKAIRALRDALRSAPQSLTEDPLQQLLIILKLMAEAMGMPDSSSISAGEVDPQRTYTSIRNQVILFC